MSTDEWRADSWQLAHLRLTRTGMSLAQADQTMAAIGDMLVTTAYHVPPIKELMRRYYSLANAFYKSRDGSIRWVMCQETHDALAEHYNQMNYANVKPLSLAEIDEDPEAFRVEVRRVMEGNLRWTDHAHLLGIPIRIDPAARTPLFEIVEGPDAGITVTASAGT